MARKPQKSKHMGFILKISKQEGKPGTWEPVGGRFNTHFEAESYHWRHYRGTPYRITGVRLSLVPSLPSPVGDKPTRRPAA